MCGFSDLCTEVKSKEKKGKAEIDFRAGSGVEIESIDIYSRVHTYICVIGLDKQIHVTNIATTTKK